MKSTIIIGSFLLCLCKHSFGQTDTAAFKRDFEKLLGKYGLSNKSYMINVNSVNQMGGQTAFIINNNFYGDTTVESNNLEYVFDTVDNHVTLFVAPKKGTWISPYVFSDTSDKHMYTEIGAGFYSFVQEHVAWVVDKWRVLGGPITPHAASYYLPFRIKLKNNDADQFFIFGDFLDPNKSFLYYKGKIQYFGLFTEEEYKKIPPMPERQKINKEE